MNRLDLVSTRTEHLGTLYFVALLREELGSRIAAARMAAGLTQQELAEQVGVRHAQDISRYERGKVEVSSYRIDKIAEATGKPRSFFTRDPGEIAPEGSQGIEDRLESLATGMAVVLENQQKILRLLRQQTAVPKRRKPAPAVPKPKRAAR